MGETGMIDQLRNLQEAALRQLEQTDMAGLEAWRIAFLGKKGELASVLRGMGALPAQERPVVGQAANDVRGRLEEAYETRRAALVGEEAARRESAEAIDVTLPGRKSFVGAEHPLRQVMRRAEDIFVGMGFTIEEGPEVELDYYNFEALNFPKDHPARDMQDTFFIHEDLLLRTHTSPVQARAMERMRPALPIRIVVLGRVYRRDDDDATHSHAFTQIEGLVVDRGVRMSDLKGTLLAFAREMFGPDQDVRLRPSFFPFTEPSAELDVRCIHCGGAGCRTCKQTGWIEILGCGMVHPNVLRTGGYDPDEVTGFAFGMGVERIAMLMYGVEDIRQFYINDLRFLRQFAALGRC
jgi:phenylalanyl-tRNA synthetase alpha chain